MAFMSTLSTFVAHNIGAGNGRRAVSALRCALAVSSAFGALMFAATCFGGGLLASLFDNDLQVISAAAEYLRGCSSEYLMISVTFCLLGYFNGREHTAFVMAQGLLSAFLVRIPLSYFLSVRPDTGMFMISIAVPVSALVSLLLCTAYFFFLRRKDNAARGK